jgi:hypothetical protein
MVLLYNLMARAKQVDKGKNQAIKRGFSLPLFVNAVLYCGAKDWTGPRPISGYQEDINHQYNRIYDSMYTVFVNLATIDYTYLGSSIIDKYYDGLVIKDEPIFRAGLIAMKTAASNLITEKLPSIIDLVTACHEDPIFQSVLEVFFAYTQAAGFENLRKEVEEKFIQLTEEFLKQYRTQEEEPHNMRTLTEALVERYGSQIVAEAKARAEAIILLLKSRQGIIPKTLEEKIFKESNTDKFNNLLIFASKCHSLKEFLNYL